jgi:hypothetical protein
VSKPSPGDVDTTKAIVERLLSVSVRSAIADAARAVYAGCDPLTLVCVFERVAEVINSQRRKEGRSEVTISTVSRLVLGE